MDCQLGFAIANWLVKHQRGTGVGTLRCSDSEIMVVRIKVKGRGITAGTHGTSGGHATFSRVRRIHDLLGSYVSGARPDEADVAGAQRLSKGGVTVILTGREGWDRGVTFDTIELLTWGVKSWRQ